MKEGKIWTLLCVLILLVQTAVETLTAVIVLRLEILPDKYMLLLLAAMALMLLFNGLLLLAGKRNTAGKKVRRIIGCMIALLVVFGCALLARVASDAYRAMNTVTKPAVTTNARNVYVLVRDDDPAQNLKDTVEYTFGIIEDYDLEHTEQAIKEIGEVIGKDPSVTEYVGSVEIAEALYSKELDAAIMNGVSIALLLEQEGYEDFTQKVRIVSTMSLSFLEESVETTAPPETLPPEDDVTNTPFIVYISGSDTRSAMLNVSRSDVNILMVVNPVTKQVLLINTPRDYYVPNPAGNGRLDKLTHCGIYGVECSIGALEGLYDMKVDFYGQINFTGLETLVDAVGGVTVYSEQSFSAGTTYISAGENTLNGAQALDFCRERYHVSGGDNGRGKNQMKVIKAVIQKMTTGTTVISKYSSILESLEGMFKTSMSMEEIGKLVKMQLSDMATWEVFTFAATGSGGSEKTYSAPGYYAYVMYPNKSVVSHTSGLIDRVLAGEILTQEDMTP